MHPAHRPLISLPCEDSPNHEKSQRNTDKPLIYILSGDSYTMSSFNIYGEQPTPADPMGNPPLGEQMKESSSVDSSRTKLTYQATEQRVEESTGWDISQTGTTLLSS